MDSKYSNYCVELCVSDFGFFYVFLHTQADRHRRTCHLEYIKGEIKQEAVPWTWPCLRHFYESGWFPVDPNTNPTHPMFPWPAWYTAHLQKQIQVH